MPHNPDAYDKEGLAKNPACLLEKMNEHFFLNEDELCYDKIKCKFIL